MLSFTGFAVAGAAVFLTYPYLRKRFVGYLWSNGTVLDELSRLGERRSDTDKIQGTAVIAGSSLAGLMAARVCADHFQTVLVVDPESWLGEKDSTDLNEDDKQDKEEDGTPTITKKRSRVPQYLATHVYQTISLWVYRKCFPDWDQQYTAAGGIIASRAYNMLYSGVPPCSFGERNSLPDLHYSNRSMLEPLLRQSVIKTCNNVSFLTGSVVGISRDPANSARIESVSLKLQGNDEIRKQNAAIFIDCAGPIKAGLKWLAEAGYGDLSSNEVEMRGKLPLKELEMSYHPRLSNSTSTFIITPDMATQLEKVIPGGYAHQESLWFYLPQPRHSNKVGGIVKVMQNQVSLFCGSWGEYILPETAEGFHDFLRSIKGVRAVEPWVYDVVDILFQEEPHTVMRYRDSGCLRVQYEKAVNLPSNFVAIGDACTRFNPIFGQGTSQGAMGCCILDDTLRNVPPGVTHLPSDFGQKFFAKQALKITDPIWMNTQTMDYGFPNTIPVQGETLSKGASLRWYVDNLSMACTWSAEARMAHNDVWMFISPPITLFSPRIVAIVLYQWWTGRTGI